MKKKGKKGKKDKKKRNLPSIRGLFVPKEKEEKTDAVADPVVVEPEVIRPSERNIEEKIEKAHGMDMTDEEYATDMQRQVKERGPKFEKKYPAAASGAPVDLRTAAEKMSDSLRKPRPKGENKMLLANNKQVNIPVRIVGHNEKQGHISLEPMEIHLEYDKKRYMIRKANDERYREQANKGHILMVYLPSYAYLPGVVEFLKSGKVQTLSEDVIKYRHDDEAQVLKEMLVDAVNTDPALKTTFVYYLDALKEYYAEDIAAGTALPMIITYSDMVELGNKAETLFDYAQEKQWVLKTKDDKTLLDISAVAQTMLTLREAMEQAVMRSVIMVEDALDVI